MPKQSSLSFLAAAASLSVLPVLTTSPAWAQEPYRLPPPEVVRILDAAPLPMVSISPSRATLLMLERENLPPISEMAQPMLRLAGVRINPDTNATHGPRTIVGLYFKDIDTGRETRVRLPEGVGVGAPRWSPDGRMILFTLTFDDRVELWTADVATGSARQTLGAPLNTLLGGSPRWMPDGRTILCQIIPEDRGAPPKAPRVPIGPTVQETTGRAGPVRTFQDLLTNAHDEALFDYYFASQIVLVDSAGGALRTVGPAAVYSGVDPSPTGTRLLVTRIERPYSYLHPYYAFPETTEVWAADGTVERVVSRQPLRDNIPIQGVQTGSRSIGWRGVEGVDQLVWAEALDGGDPRVKIAQRDKVMLHAAPFNDEPRELLRTEHRFTGLSYSERPGVTMASEYDRDKRWSRTWIVDVDKPGAEPRLLWDRSVQDRYNNPGSPVTVTTPSGRSVVMIRDGAALLTGAGASPEGDRPFIDRLDLATLETTRLWRNAGERYESVSEALSDDGSRILIRRESPADPPNYFVVDLATGAERKITDFADPAPELRDIRKEIVTYPRADGVELSATLYLPPGYTEGTRLPLVVWAYPTEFVDPATASQVSGSPWRFTLIGGSSHLFFLTQGYAIMDGAAMPVVGDPETVNDTFVEQIVSSAQAAIDKAVEMGVADRDRVGVGGHSYGAFMTANLLAHSDIFRAGIARSGAYNRTLTPFGFQSERRTFWEAPEVYINLSPFTHAHKIDEPILLIHGEVDNNSGTFPMQSERLYHAVQGHGGAARLVMLPHESHGYRARESVLHTLAEMIEWFDVHVKNASGSSARRE